MENPPSQPQPYPHQPDPRVLFGVALRAATPRVFFCYLIIVLNIAYFALMCARGVDWINPTGESLIAWGADHSQHTPNGQWWRLITSAFMHAGIIHLLVNMWALFNFGALVERLYGNLHFLVLYMACAALSGMASVRFEQDVASVGASGAIFGVLGALLSYLAFQRKSIPAEIAKSISTSTLIFVGYNVVMGLSTPGISNAAHIGGLIAGLVLGAILGRPLPLERRKRQAAPRLVMGLLLAGALIAGGIYEIPKVDQTPTGKFEAMETRFLSEEREMEKILVSLGNQSDLAYAQTLQTEIIPRLDRMIAWLKQIDFKSRPGYAQEQSLKLTFAQERRRGFELCARGLAEGNKKMVEEGTRIFDDAMKAYNNVIRAHNAAETKPAKP